MHPYDKALDKIWDRINVDMPHSEDYAAVVDLFDRMIRAGKRVTSPEEIGNYLVAKDMDADIALKIQWTYEVLEHLQYTSGHSLWNEDFIKDLL